MTSAVNLYEQLASSTVHEVVGEFQALPLDPDPEQRRELDNGRVEVEELR